MSTFTKNYNLEKPAQNDFYDIDVQNKNMDKIDSALRKLRITFPASGWSSSAPYTQTINGLDITATDTPERWFDFPDPVPEGFDYDKYTEETGFVTYCETGDGSIKAVCRTDKPTMDLVVVFKGC